ncbi:MAG: type II secretion system protein [Candidatus Omnitrophota bacterium]
MNIKTKRGFTFIETMVVVAILSVIAMVLGGVINNGLSLWNRVNDIRFEEDASIFFDKFTMDVKNAIRFGSISFSGSDISVSIPSLTLKKDGQESPGLVTYYFDEKKETMNRQDIDFIDLINEEEAEERVMLKGVVSAKFFYYTYNESFQSYEWVEEYKDDLPQAVRLKMFLKNAADTTDHIRTVDIPAGRLEFFNEEENVEESM